MASYWSSKWCVPIIIGKRYSLRVMKNSDAATPGNTNSDKAKKIFTTDNATELQAMKDKYRCVFRDKNGKDVKPNFFIHLARKKGFYIAGVKNYKKHKTSMDYLQRVVNQYNSKTIKTKEYIQLTGMMDDNMFDTGNAVSEQVTRVMDLVRYQKDYIHRVYSKPESEIDSDTKRIMAMDVKLAVLIELRKMKFSPNTAYYLMKKLEAPENAEIKTSVFYALMGIPNKTFYDIFIRSKKDLSYLKEDEAGDVLLYGIKFAKVYKKQ